MKPDEYNLTLLNHFIYKPIEKNRKLHFSELEKRWLAKKQPITYVYDPDWAPFEWKNGIGEHTGIISDIMKIISKDTGIKFIPMHTKTWSGSVEVMKNHKADMYSAVSYTKDREEHFALTKANIYTYPVVLVSEIEHNVVNPENDLKGKRIGVIKGNALSVYVKNRYPEATFIEVLSVKEGFDRVTNNSIDLFAINAATASYFIHQKGYSEIKIYKELEYKLQLKIALQKTMPKELLTILDKSLQNINREDLNNIFNKWTMSVEKEKEKVDYSLIWKIFMLLIFFLILMTYYNIKLRKQNKIIKNEKDKFQNIFDKASDGISIMTNGVFTECNDALVKILKYKDKSKILKFSPASLSPQFQPDGQASLAKSLLMIEIANKQGVHHFEWRHLKADGTEFWAEIILTNISNHVNENIIHVVWRDIEKRKEAKERLKELNFNLEEQVTLELEKNKKQQVMIFQQSRHAQMGEMLSMIAHQWRQPLAAISATSAVIELKAQKNMLDAANIETSARNISDFSQHLSTTINDFKDFFKLNKEKSKTTYDEVIASVLRIIEISISNKNIQLIQELNCHETFSTYPNELKQVVLNLIKNAEDALLEKVVEDPTIKIATYTNKDKHILEISDNAGGIPENIIEKIFDPYFSTKTKKDGTGLGLYMSKTIIEEHCGGELSVINGENGAIFKIILRVNNE